ncbi:VOC family protein [Gulosibacter molinativorax]|uniref:Glyoxalase n=1 Tax=Gulosibacter molinativorax TaxID=256821 RepID=A0ABT7C6S0_9MICO|nr:VOC family protein [Gulosibacter molinativorax]MDJ1370366.1 glyoxalase [Gulosibacter molinativorax]
MDAVTLRVGDLENMSSYYESALALVPIEERANREGVQRVLGRGDVPLIRLVETKGLPEVNLRSAGLFHTAFLFDTHASLAATVYSAASDQRSRFAGSSDHSVSEAFYFQDPENNGIELYIDRPRDQWHRNAAHEIDMTTTYLDPNAYLRTHLDENVLANAAKQVGVIGHVHLQVGDLATARDFYVDALGFEATLASYSGALFASAGGYHHHVAMNVWNSAGAAPRAATLGLGDVAVTVPAREDLDALVARLRAKNIQFEDSGNAVVARDPWNTQVTVALPAASAEDLLAR